MKNRLFSYVFALSVLLWSNGALAVHPKGPPPPGGWKPETGVALGVGAAYVHDGSAKHAFAPSLEATFFKKVYKPVFFWLSGGAKLFTGKETAAFPGVMVTPYIETGFNLLPVNIGVGYGPGFGDDKVQHQINMFFGAGIPLKIPDNQNLIFLHIFYRPVFTVAPDHIPVAHEMGLMFKWMFIKHGEDK